MMSISLDEWVDSTFAPVTNAVASVIFFSVRWPGTSIDVPLILIWLLLAGLFFTINLRFINISCLKHSIDIVTGKYDNQKDKGEVSHYQALAAALSGTLGLGNIAGVAIAISSGGPGATLWMIIAGLIGMSSKFAECTLGVKYRNIHADGSVSGGPMYYLEKGFAQRGFKTTGKVLAVIFAVCCVGGSLGGGNMFQSNQATLQMLHVFFSDNAWMKENAWVIGLASALLVGTVIIGGIKSIASVSQFVVPIMCGIYILGALVIIAVNYQLVPSTIMIIMEQAFYPKAVAGGMLGTLIQGFQRASFSNEAGIGSASIAHSAVKTEDPVSEGMVGLLEPFIDTVVVCTVTAFLVVITGVYQYNIPGGVQMTSLAFETVMPWFPYILTVAVYLFAFATMISWSYYGSKSWEYLFGDQRWINLTFKGLFCFFTLIGASMKMSNVVLFSDAMIFSMSLPNIAGLFMMAPEIKKDLKAYLNKLND